MATATSRASRAMSRTRRIKVLAPCLLGVVVIAADLSLAFGLQLGTPAKVVAVAFAVVWSGWWINFGRNLLLGRDVHGGAGVAVHPMVGVMSSEASELRLSVRRTARRALTAFLVIEAVAIGLLLLLHPSLHALTTQTGNTLDWLPLGAVLLTPFITLRVNVAARRADRVLDGPVTTAYATTHFEGALKRRYVVVLRSTPDGDPFAKLRVVYTKPQRYLYVSGVEATLYGSLDSGSAAVAVTSKGAFVGRMR